MPGLDEIAERLAARAGLRPPEWVLEQRVAERARERGVEPAGYAALLDDAAELAALVEAVRVGETRFFRHRAQVDALSRVVVPALLRAGVRRARAWSAGCASGEEAYTVAMVLAAAFADVAVLGTDISDEALACARAGRYRREAAAQVPEGLRRFVVESGAEARVAPALARLVRFERHNLLDPLPAGSWEVILCRNVLIYFDAPTRQRVVERLAAALSPGGFLLVGYAESARQVEGLEATEAAGVYRRPSTPTPRPRPRPRPRAALSPTPVAPSSPGPIRVIGSPSADELGLLLREAIAEDSVVVDLDGAEFLDDALAPLLRRAAAAVKASGGRLVLSATRPGPRRWIERHKL